MSDTLPPYSDAFVETSIKGRIAYIRFGTSKSNSMPGFLLEKLAADILAAGQEKTVTLIVLSSGGDQAFCAGASFDELMAIQDLDTSVAFFGGFAKVLLAMKNCGKIVVVRVQGKVTGGGVGIVCAADYCFATRAAEMALPEINLGIGPFVIGPFVERKIGKAGLMEMALDASFRSADWAKNHGVYQWTGESIEELDRELDKFVTQLSSRNADALALLKKVAWEGTDHLERMMPDRILMSASLVLDPAVKKTIETIKMKLSKK